MGGQGECCIEDSAPPITAVETVNILEDLIIGNVAGQPCFHEGGPFPLENLLATKVTLQGKKKESLN